MMELTYFFGYGSLMFPAGINGRGMKYKYGWYDLVPATLSGYRRGMFTHYFKNYYGILPSPGDTVSGILFRIHSEEDLETLLRNEFASETQRADGLMYEPVDVYDSVGEHRTPNGEKTCRIIALVSPEDRSSLGKTSDSYIGYVYRGISLWGPDFVNSFLSTGGIKPTHVLSGILPLYTGIKCVKKISFRIRDFWRKIWKPFSK